MSVSCLKNNHALRWNHNIGYVHVNGLTVLSTLNDVLSLCENYAAVNKCSSGCWRAGEFLQVALFHVGDDPHIVVWRDALDRDTASGGAVASESCGGAANLGDGSLSVARCRAE
jgi:hypothetical protein